MVTGLAWTSVGGDLLHIEALKLPGKGRMKTTGKLGDVMKESIDAAASYVRSISPQIGVKPPKFETMDIHVHVPDGATPKDGPSAGLAMVTAIVSVLTGIPVRKDIAMTGEVTLARQRDADRRAERETARRAARGDQDRLHSGGERQGPGGDSGEREDRPARSSP